MKYYLSINIIFEITKKINNNALAMNRYLQGCIKKYIFPKFINTFRLYIIISSILLKESYIKFNHSSTLLCSTFLFSFF